MADHQPFLNDDPCDCPDARAFRALMNSPVGEGIDRLASTLAVWKLRQMSHEFSAAMDWTRPFIDQTKRDTYDTPGRTVGQIRAEARKPWEGLTS